MPVMKPRDIGHLSGIRSNSKPPQRLCHGKPRLDSGSIRAMMSPPQRGRRPTQNRAKAPQRIAFEDRTQRGELARVAGAFRESRPRSRCPQATERHAVDRSRVISESEPTTTFSLVNLNALGLNEAY